MYEELAITLFIGFVVIAFLFRSRLFNRPRIDLLKIALSGEVAPLEKYVGPVDDVKDENNNTPLIIACKLNHFELVKVLLAKGADLKARNKHLFTPLHMACYSNASIELVHYLISKGANKEALDHNAWTPLHMVASNGFANLAVALLDVGAYIDALNSSGQTPLIIAACNGHTSVVVVLLERGANALVRTNQKLESALYYAAKNLHLDIVKLLLEKNKELLEFPSHDGTLPIHCAVGRGSIELVNLLIKYGANIKSKKKDGSGVLHIAANLGDAPLVLELIKLGCDLEGKDSFGCTPLHRAATRKNAAVVQVLLTHGANPNQKDNDKLTPLHSLCSSPPLKDKNPSPSASTEIFEALIHHGADLFSRDSTDATPLHHAVCRPHNISLVKSLLEKNPEMAFHCDKTSRTPLHLVSQMYNHPEVVEVLTDYMKKYKPDFFHTFDPKHNVPIDHQTVQSLLSESERNHVLGGDVSLNGIVKLIKSGNVKNIIVLTGAGISTNAGIPDFRSPLKGLYTNPPPALAEKLKDFKDPFSVSGFEQAPEIFFHYLKEIFLPVAKGLHKPTQAHHFLFALQKRDILLRNYTQNIDNLERVAGIHTDKVIEAHGGFISATCERCRTTIPIRYSDPDDHFWSVIEKGGLPTCLKCKGDSVRHLLKPDVVLFGESLTARFFDSQKGDFEKCDLLIVMGTTLVVYPFAGLVNSVQPHVPRLLFNTDAVGAFTKGAKQTIQDGKLVKLEDGLPGTYRDVSVLGDIDKSVEKMVELLGWNTEGSK